MDIRREEWLDIRVRWGKPVHDAPSLRRGQHCRQDRQGRDGRGLIPYVSSPTRLHQPRRHYAQQPWAYAYLCRKECNESWVEQVYASSCVRKSYWDQGDGWVEKWLG